MLMLQDLLNGFIKFLELLLEDSKMCPGLTFWIVTFIVGGFRWTVVVS